MRFSLPPLARVAPVETAKRIPGPNLSSSAGERTMMPAAIRPMADDKKQKTLFLDDTAPTAPPRQSAPPSSGQSTMMLDAAQAPGAQPPGGQRQVVVPTMMQQPPAQQLPPMQRPLRQTAWGRWVVGPILSIVVAAGTVYAANLM